MTNSNDDFNLWVNLIKDVKKIKNTKKITQEQKPLPKINSYKQNTSLPLNHNYNTKNLKDLQLNNNAGIDHSSIKKIERGEYPIDGTLDLHGMNQEQALSSLTKFIESSYQMRKRLLLVIVGKGKQSENRKGLLRELVPSWINYPTLRPMIINIKTASQKHGGEGAIYILLKRIRNDSNH